MNILKYNIEAKCSHTELEQMHLQLHLPAGITGSGEKTNVSEQPQRAKNILHFSFHPSGHVWSPSQTQAQQGLVPRTC